MLPVRRLPLLCAVAGMLAAAPAQDQLPPAYPDHDILSPFRKCDEVYAPPDAVFLRLRRMRDVADEPGIAKEFDAEGREVLQDPRWQAARAELGTLLIDAGYLAEIMRRSKNADDRDLAFYGAFFCGEPAHVFNLIGHIPGEPQQRTREQAYPRAVAYIKAHARRRWGDLTDEQKKAANLPEPGSPAARAAGITRGPRDDDYLFQLNLVPFLQLLDLDSTSDQAQALWFIKECCLIRKDLAARWLEAALPRIDQLLRGHDRTVRQEAIGLLAAIGPARLTPPAPTAPDSELAAFADRARRELFPPIRVISEALVLLLPGADRDAIASAGRQALLDAGIGEVVNQRGDDGTYHRGFRIGRVPDELKVLQLPAGALITTVNGAPVDDGQQLLAVIERQLSPGKDRKGNDVPRKQSLVVEYLHGGKAKAIEYRVL
ncbi:MAG TPA: hypothetical protein VK348_02570 [Planctomycetota bacterium]|nr:hypothetical protein [Planctomycetota bacterium]